MMKFLKQILTVLSQNKIDFNKNPIIKRLMIRKCHEKTK